MKENAFWNNAQFYRLPILSELDSMSNIQLTFTSLHLGMARAVIWTKKQLVVLNCDGT